MFEIDNPCEERWEAMAPRGEGRFCARCERVVVDLSRLTRAQAEARVKRRAGRTCLAVRRDVDTHAPVFRPEPSVAPRWAGGLVLAAALTGCTPRYGFHLDERRRGTACFDVTHQPATWTEWGALGGLIGRAMASYYEVPVINGIHGPAPTSDDLKHFGAALASYGSTALFHMVGVTPEAPDLQTVFDGPAPDPTKIGKEDFEDFLAGYGAADDALDVVVFAAPQLSLLEMECCAYLLKDRQVHRDVALLIATNPENKHASDRMGLTQMIEDAGAVVLEGVCFYQMHARELGEANNWTRLMTNSAKLTNIIGGYGYEPVLADMERCIDSAVAGRIV